MSKTKKILFSITSLACASSLISVPAIASSCNNGSSTSEDQQKEVIFAAPQGAQWPLMNAMKSLVAYYNKTHTNDENFVKVTLKTAEDVKTFSELALVNNTINNIDSKAKEIPNILLSNQSGAFILKSRNALLDLQKEGLNVKFNDKIQKLHSILAGQTSDNVDQLYNIPFDICDIDALVFNLDIMHKIFKMIEDNGGHVDKNMDLYKKAEKASTEGNSIPERSAFNAMIAKPQNNFKTMNVNDDTFASFENIRKFVNDVYDNVTFDPTKLDKVTDNAGLLSIDYQQDVFLKELQAKNSSNQRLWNLVKTDDQNQPTKVDFTNLLNSNSEPAKNLVSLFNDWKLADKGENIKPASGDTKAVTFKTFDYKKNGNADWGNFDIKKYDSAISYAASVGANQAQQSLWSIAYFLGGDLNDPKHKAEYEKWATHYDVITLSSVDREKIDGKKVYNEGGSSIVGVKSSNEKLNKGVINFLNFLYNGTTKVGDKDVPNYLILAEGSGYIVPFKNVVTNETLQSFETARDAYIQQWEANKDSSDKNVSLQAQFALVKANNLQSSIASLKSLLKFADDSQNVEDVNNVGDNKTAQVVTKMEQELLKMTNLKEDGTPESTLTGEQFLKELQDIAKSK